MNETQNTIVAYPVRIIPFDLGMQLNENDAETISVYLNLNYISKILSPRQRSIMKGCIQAYTINRNVDCYLYKNGMCVISIEEDSIEYKEDSKYFSILYDENRKCAHNQLFAWKHEQSACIKDLIDRLREIVRKNTKSKESIRKSANADFENEGLSYVMTLSLFDFGEEAKFWKGFKYYPLWLKNNVYALLDPSLVYLEDSSKFVAVNEIEFDVATILNELEIEEEPKDYEKHRHLNAYMSWAAVILLGHIQSADLEEYVGLEVQLQSDWFYVYCMEKDVEELIKKKKEKSIQLQKVKYELELLEDRLYDFDDSSMPNRILEVQQGLVLTSSLNENIQHLQKKINFFLAQERLQSEIKQKKLGQSSETLLFIIAMIEIAPILAEYGNKIFSGLGTISVLIISLGGILLFMNKNR